MSTNALKTAVTGKSVAASDDPKSIFGMLKVYQSEIQRALPRHMSPDRMARIVTTEIRKAPLLLQCDARSLFGAVISASQLGLEPGLNGRAFLVPYFNNSSQTYECQLIPGWKGLVELANRTGRASCWTGAVYEGDQFAYQLGDSPFVKHVPMGEDDESKLTHVYAIGRVRDSEWPIVEVWTVARVARHRDRYNRQGKKHYSYREWEMYARKIPLLQVLKYLPSSPELEAAVAISQAAEIGSQGLTLDGVLGTDYAPPADPGQTEREEAQEAAGAPNGGEVAPPYVEHEKAAPRPEYPAGGGPAHDELVAMIGRARSQDDLLQAKDVIRGRPVKEQASLLALVAAVEQRIGKEG